MMALLLFDILRDEASVAAVLMFIVWQYVLWHLVLAQLKSDPSCGTYT